jgi:NAD(P)-dependent dehydrogenase (short-subunit alcohol dehydrogenase family)
MIERALVIGAGGGIGQELVKQLAERHPNAIIHSVSRTDNANLLSNQHHHCLDSTNENEVDALAKTFATQNVKFDTVICTTGVLHTSGHKTLKPEKRLEDISTDQLAEYFRVNTAVPAIWLKFLVKLLNKDGANVVFFSARVGSISENGLGGWYGYRASKAALNMIVKTASVEYARRSPKTILACYHPGTVDTELSKPFQANVKPGKLFTTEFTVSQLLSHMQKFDIEQSPYYIDWDGQNIAY